MKCYLAVDLGASSGRVLAGLFENEKLELVEMHRFWNGAVEHGDELHWGIDQLFTEIKTGLKKGFETYGDAVQAIGIDTWGVDYGLLDANGNLINAPFQYRDSRNDGMMDFAFSKMPKDEIYRRTGLQFMPFNTVFQLCAELKRPEFEKAEKMLLMPDLFTYWLTGKAVSEYTMASTSQLLDANKRDWDWELIETLGLPKKIFCDIVQPGTIIGQLTDEMAQELGGNADVIAVGGHDTASAVAAAPLASKDCAYLSSGTWSLMGLEEPEPIITDTSAEYNITNEGGVCGTIRFLKNICGMWLLQECKRNWEEAGEELSWRQIDDLVLDTDPFIAFINPDAPEFAQPCDMPKQIQEFCRRTGQYVPEGIGEIGRVIFESLAMRYRDVFQTLEKLHGKPLEKLHIVGGGCRNILLNRLTADAIDRPVLAGPVEATGIGNMLMQMIAKKEVSTLPAGRDMVLESFGTELYEPQETASWNDAFERFLSIM
ncbi:rhamnulokinase [Tichowtungia aerotolerans]|uniref:Rhamnulokinase n=1 Tax=Tichowtungia aerotolerans TaxID=2697043 RepID=A0A6P1M982_9BACT|nr:rhamnulokinase family protein [Tichowtungia aerotolerans]QHI68146.1 rhamnulokinase [Tichowtungia aerotolerans]